MVYITKYLFDLDNTNLIQLVAAIDPDYLDEYQEEVMKMMLSARQ